MAKWLDSTWFHEKDTGKDTRRTLVLSSLKVMVVDVISVVVTLDVRSLTDGERKSQGDSS